MMASREVTGIHNWAAAGWSISMADLRQVCAQASRETLISTARLLRHAVAGLYDNGTAHLFERVLGDGKVAHALTLGTRESGEQ